MKINTTRSKIIQGLILSTGTLIISGCMLIGPDYITPETKTPDAWHTSVTKDLKTTKSPMHKWWTVFNDEKLNSIIADVSSNNCSLATAAERIIEAAARYGIAQSALSPEFFAHGSYTRVRDSESIKFKGDYPENPYNLYDSGFNMSWELDLWGRVERSVEAAQAGIDASVEDYRDLLVVLQADAATTYIGIRTAQQRLQYTRNNLALQSKTLKLTEDRYKAELTSELDVRQAEMNIATTKALIPELETIITKLLNRLCVLTGREPGAYDFLIKERPAVPNIESIPALLPAELLRSRPDVRAAERRLAAQTAFIGVAKAELLPMFSLNGYFDWQASSSSEWFDSKARTYGFGPSFSWSILNYGRVRNQIAVEESLTRQALTTYRQTVLNAWQETEDTLTSFAKEQERSRIISDAVKAAVRSEELVQVQYKNGLTDFQNVLDTQRILFQQQDTLALSQGKVAGNLIAVYKAFGGGWMPEENINSNGDNNE